MPSLRPDWVAERTVWDRDRKGAGMDDEGLGDLPRFALAVYRCDGVPAACLLLQNRLDLDVNLILFAAYVGAVRNQHLTESDVTTARDRVRDWHSEVVRPLRSVRQRLNNGPSPAPSPATTELRRKLQELEIEFELIELGQLDEVVAGLDGPAALGKPADRSAAGIVTMAAAAAGRALDDTELGAVSAIAAAAAAVGITEGR
jgi:uncharacterized protein (TIGR02444 family)